MPQDAPCRGLRRRDRFSPKSFLPVKTNLPVEGFSMPHDYTYEPENQALARPGDVKRGELAIVRDTQSLEPVSLRDATFAKSGTKPLLVKQAKILRAPIEEEEEADILP